MVLPEPDIFCLTDLWIYNAQMRKILLSTLYYLEVKADGQILYGVTTRDWFQTSNGHNGFAITSRQINNVLGTWSSRWTLKSILSINTLNFNHPIGSLTEYFAGFEEAIAVKRDLSRWSKVLSPLEQENLKPVQSSRHSVPKQRIIGDDHTT